MLHDKSDCRFVRFRFSARVAPNESPNRKHCNYPRKEPASKQLMRKWDRNHKTAKSILDVIGNTPLVRLNRVTAEIKPEICVKLEYFSPSGSLKDRIYLNMIERAERRGDLKAGMTILECSTGNAGIAC